MFIAVTVIKVFDSFTLADSIVWAFGASMALFFSWALCRELDPDNNPPAFIAVAITFGVLFAEPSPSLLVLLWFLLLLRIVNRITGLAPPVLMLVIFAAFSVLLSMQSYWFCGLAASPALYANYYLEGKKKHAALIGITVLLSATLPVLFIEGYFAPLQGFDCHGITSSIIAFVFIFMTLKTSKLASVTDITAEPLHADRFKIAGVLAVSTALLAVLWLGEEAFGDLLPLWSAVCSILIWRLLLIIKHFTNR